MAVGNRVVEGPAVDAAARTRPSPLWRPRVAPGHSQRGPQQLGDEVGRVGPGQDGQLRGQHERNVGEQRTRATRIASGSAGGSGLSTIRPSTTASIARSRSTVSWSSPGPPTSCCHT